jgi:hypothetical protein
MGRLSGARRRRAGSAARTALAVGILAFVASLAPAGVQAADLARFGIPTAESSFVDGLEFRQPVTIGRPLARVELLLTIASAIGPQVIAVPTPADTGATTLAYTFVPDVDGQLTANSRVVARWRLVSGGDPNDVALGPEVAVTYADDRYSWRSVSGDLVTVHWYEGPSSFGDRALAIGETAVRDAAKLLGVTESEPIDFFVYADRDAFYDVLGPGTRENVGGAQIPGVRTMFALITPDSINDSWVATVVPHELTHLVFETAAANPYHFPPRWLNEGLAVYLSQGYDLSDQRLVADAVGDKTLIPLEGLSGQFPTSLDGFSLAYAESVAAVDFMVREHGPEAMVSLIRSYAQGRTDDEAFDAALGQDLGAFGSAWLDELGAAEPERYGPQPDPPGPIPEAWLAAPTGSSAPAPSDHAATAAPGASATPGGPGSGGDGTTVALLVVGGLVVVVVVVAIAIRRRRPSVPGAIE